MPTEEVNYVEGMPPPDEAHPVNEDEEEEFDYILWKRNFRKWNRKSYAKRKAIIMTLVPIVLGILCWIAWGITIDHINQVRAEAGLQPVRVW